MKQVLPKEITLISTSTSEYLILARLMSSWSAGEHILRPMGSIFFSAATIREVCTE